jgi:molybdate transport system substrate-binding protein
MKRRILAVVAAILVLAGISSAQNQKEISVLGSILFKPALDKLIPGFESKTGYKVKFTWGSGVTARERVASGEIFDASIVFAPFTDALASGQVVVSSAKTLAGIKLSVTVRQGAPKPDISSAEAVKRTLLAAKSLTYVDPARGTIGQNALATLQRLGIVEQLRSKTVLATGGGNAQELVAKGAAEINLGPYFNDELVPGVERIGALPRNVSTPTAIVGLIGIHAKDPAAAKALLDYLSSAEANAVYKEIGMEPVP